MNNTLKVAVIGCGIGKSHARGYVQAGDCQLVAVCDLDPMRAEQAAREFNVRAYTSLEKLLATEHPDIVSVATNEDAHESVTIAALEAGCHVLCEKIMAHTLSAAHNMLAVARRTGRVLGVNYNYRHVPAFAFLKECLDTGRAGRPVLLVAQTHSYCWHHMLDLACFLLGTPVAVQAVLVDDPDQRPYRWENQREMLYIPSIAVSATLQFASGALATITSTMHTNFDEQMMAFSLYTNQERIELHHINPGSLAGQALPGPFAKALALFPPVTLEKSFTLSTAAFVQAIRIGQRPATTGEDGLAIMQIEQAIVLAAREGKTVSLRLGEE